MLNVKNQIYALEHDCKSQILQTRKAETKNRTE